MRRRNGQTLLETCIIMMVLCLVFFGLIQLSQLSTSKEILDYAASCGTRARTVGFNEFMVTKVIRVAAIPNAGRIVEPEIDRPDNPAAFSGTPGMAMDYAIRAQPTSPQFPVENARIPLYLGAENWGRTGGILDYENWGQNSSNTIHSWIHDMGGIGLGVHTSQEVPLWAPLHRLIYNGDSVHLSGDAILENHYPLYLGNGPN